MTTLFDSVSNASTMIEGFSYDRTNFMAGSLWTRSLLSGAISTGLTGLGVYCAYQMVDPAFAAVLGAKAVQVKIAASGILCALLGYSLRDLFRSIEGDVITKLRVARANSWLSQGSACLPSDGDWIEMKHVQLSMVRFVEEEAGIKVFAIGMHQQIETPFLVQAAVMDQECPVEASLVTSRTEIRTRLTEACAEWAPTVADMLGIQLDTPSAKTALEFEDAGLDDDFVFDDVVPAAVGRASASSAAKHNVERSANSMGDILRKAGTRPDDARIQ